jgi:hypothetical protein
MRMAITGKISKRTSSPIKEIKMSKILVNIPDPSCHHNRERLMMRESNHSANLTTGYN